MTESDRDKFNGMIINMHEIKNKPIKENLLPLWFDLFKEIDIDKLEIAIKKAIMLCEYPPQPNDLMKYLDIKKPLTAEEMAEKSYQRIKTYFLHYSGHDSVSFSDMALMHALRVSGSLPEIKELVCTKNKDFYFQFKNSYIYYYEMLKSSGLSYIGHLSGYMENLGGEYNLHIIDFENKKSESLYMIPERWHSHYAGNPNYTYLIERSLKRLQIESKNNMPKLTN